MMIAHSGAKYTLNEEEADTLIFGGHKFIQYCARSEHLSHEMLLSLSS